MLIFYPLISCRVIVIKNRILLHRREQRPKKLNELIKVNTSSPDINFLRRKIQRSYYQNGELDTFSVRFGAEITVRFSLHDRSR